MPYPIAFSAWVDRRIDGLLPTATPASARAAQARAQTRLTQLATPAPPAPPARPGQLALPTAAPRNQRRPGERPAPGREGQTARERESLGGAPEGRADSAPVAPVGERQQGHSGDQDADEGGAGEASSAVTDVAGSDAAQEDLDSALIAGLLGQSHDSGMFEVLLPGGETLGVAVDVRADAIDYLLTPDSERVATQLRGRQMELAGQLGQRIGRSVRVTVL